MPTAKQQALAMVKKFPGKATWDDIMYEIYVSKKIDAGVTAANAGKVVPHIVIKQRFLIQLPPD